jgi:hypothetical protein
VGKATLGSGLDTRKAIVVVHIAVKVFRKCDRQNGQKAENEVHCSGLS